MTAETTADALVIFTPSGPVTIRETSESQRIRRIVSRPIGPVKAPSQAPILSSTSVSCWTM